VIARADTEPRNWSLCRESHHRPGSGSCPVAADQTPSGPTALVGRMNGWACRIRSTPWAA